MIVIKCISQFGFFPWSSKIYCSISAEAPFALPNIIGIEKKDGYAQMDLVQLLALFLHRYILKVLQTILNKEERLILLFKHGFVNMSYNGCL